MIKYIMIGGITIDDTIMQNGRVKFNAAGGNAIYSALGANLWADGIGIVGRVGPDYPEGNLITLAESGLDVQGIQKVDFPSQHLWLLYEKDGSRQFVFHKNSGTMDSEIDPVPDQIPEAYQSAKMAHLSGMGSQAQYALAKYLISHHIDYSYDITQASLMIDKADYIGNYATVNSSLLLPSIEEIELIYGQQPLLPLLRNLAESGPKYIVVKMGSRGSIAFDSQKNQAYHIPIFPVEVVDPTGAGDAFCGGFMAGFCESGSLLEAGLYGTVSASFAIQDFGSFHLLDVNKKDALKRLDYVRKNVEIVPVE